MKNESNKIPTVGIKKWRELNELQNEIKKVYNK